MHTALHEGDISAVSCSRLTISDFEGSWHSLIRFEDVPAHFAVNKNRPDLLEELNRAQAEILNINAYYGEELKQKYLGAQADTKPALTDEERAWLNSKNEITVGYCDGRRPIAYKNADGNLSGLLNDYLDKMTREYGIRFKTRAYPDGTSMLSALKSGEVDVISPVGYTHGMAENSGISITNPIIVDSMVAVFRGYEGTDKRDIYGKIAVVKNSVSEKDYARRYYPDATLIEAETISAAIKAVESGEADSYMTYSVNHSWLGSELDTLRKLQTVTLPNACYISMAARTEDVTLLPILNKGISLLNETDVTAAIVAHSATHEPATLGTFIKDNPATAIITLIALLLLIVLAYLFIRLLTEKKYLARLKTANAAAEEAKTAAEEASKAKSTFLTSMSHDIRTPMNAIIGMTTLASKHINNTEYVRNCLSKVTLASDHLLTLINDVLDINKIETGKLSMNPTVFSLADSIMNLANIGRNQLREKEHRFEIRIHNIKQEYLFADELRINQIFINLLSNAVKYTPAGGRITVDIKEETIPGEGEKIRLIYIVEDSGIGMSEEFQAHMYELFAMANKNQGTVSGSGVGLAICRQLVELMEGTIDCESRLGEGTKFTVKLELPIADKVVDRLMLPPMKLLLVDDDEVFLATASETLRELGLSPDTAESGEEAIKTVVKHHNDGKDYPLIIIDWKMPGIDGIETTRRIRAEVGNDVSIIVISAYAPEEIGEAAIAAGANGFINKPFFPSNVYESLSRVLGLEHDSSDEFSYVHKRVRGMKLLIAEDNDLNWEIAHELLKMYGITAERAENGKLCLEALESAERGSFDAVLMDIQMPLMNGYDAARAIRAHEREDIYTIPIIAMTADAYREDVLQCAEAGMNSHIAKPIDMDKLLEVLAELRS